MRKTVGPDDQSITFPVSHLAVTVYNLKQVGEVEQLALEVLHIREKAFGKYSLPVGKLVLLLFAWWDTWAILFIILYLCWIWSWLRISHYFTLPNLAVTNNLDQCQNPFEIFTRTTYTSLICVYLIFSNLYGRRGSGLFGVHSD